MTPAMMLCLSFLASFAIADDRLEKLTPEHRKWLEQEVVYVITEAEREAFLSIETADVRNQFIEAFWKKRDPNPATLRNEFKEELYRRLEYANDVLGRETPRPGYRTDRGRYYILLGEPREIQRYDREELQPIELWFYDGDRTLGLPPFFYLLFFKPYTTGEFELYHPTFHGPTALLIDSQARAPTNQRALEMLRDVSVELARASLSFDPSERPYEAGAISSAGTDMLLGRIEEAPKRLVRTDYIDAWRRYGRRVSTDYSFNFVPSRATFAVLVGPEDTSFVHYSIEIDPQNFNLETDEDRAHFYTVVDLDTEIRDASGKLVVAKQREIPFELTPSQFQQVQASPVAIQGAFPIVPGKYNLSLIARNRVLKQYTVAERDVAVATVEPARPELSSVVLGFRAEMVSPGAKGEVRPFQVESWLVHPAADGVFAIGETVHLLMQARGAGSEDRVRFELLDELGNLLLEREAEVGHYPDGLVVDRLELSSLSAAGRYTLRTSLKDDSGEILAERSDPLVVSPRTGVVRAGYLSRQGFNGAVAGLLALERGEQLLGVGRFEEGVAELERAVAANNPDLPMARWKLASALVNSGKIGRTLELLSPLEESYPDQFEVVAGLGFAYYHRLDFDRCRGYLERALTLRPPYPALLNTLADCYERSGHPDGALATFERSLEMDPDQPLVEERVAALRSRP
ncbi:MAG TPA: GWxTD domain-containing protein [Vicinamibacteria bacterium]|nr:GWxTD domain-containing protein [Vicinamibacteria bacterium]